MDVVLIAGFWLTGDSWNEVAPALREAGLTVHTPTLAGMGSVEADRSEVTLATHVAEVVALVDSLTTASGGGTGPSGGGSGSGGGTSSGGGDRQVVLVGHSGGGAIIHAVVDARPDRVAHAVYVDSWPTAEGNAINEELEAEGSDVPLPAWEVFGEADLRDLSAEQREWFRSIAVPQPVGVAREPQRLSHPERFEVPITLVGSTFTEQEVQEYAGSGHPLFAEIPRIRSVSVVEIPTGHWPQFTKPGELAEAIVAVARTLEVPD
jgi:pimeloyl-ACP methyl ester carboxylesterase